MSVAVVSLQKLDAALYEPAHVRRPGQSGRPLLKGERLPKLSEVAKDPTTVWKPAKIANWYGSFFFQAEDGIRDVAVTGVQTCALPILTVGPGVPPGQPATGGGRVADCDRRCGVPRSEERRVGKECRCRWPSYHYKNLMPPSTSLLMCAVPDRVGGPCSRASACPNSPR